MNFHLTDLIISQAATFGVMFSAGILTESLWQVKRYVQDMCADAALARKAAAAIRILTEALFWAAAAAVLSGFLYYCAFGKLSIHAAVGFLAGLLLWKKFLRYAIMRA